MCEWGQENSEIHIRRKGDEGLIDVEKVAR
jgi:hypothetical protein